MNRRLAKAFLGSLLILVPVLAYADAEADLEKALGTHDAASAKRALAAATQAGDAKAAAVILKEALRMRDMDAHREIIDAIKGIKADDAVAKLADAAKHSDKPDLRYILIEGLALQGSPAAQKAAFEGLDDKDETVLIAATRGARAIASGEAIEKLIGRLEKAEKNPREASLCRELNGALATITGESLSFGLEWRGWWLSHKDGFKSGAPAPKEPAGGDAKPADPKPQGEAKGAQGLDGNRGGSGDEPNSGGETVEKRMKRERPADAHTLERMAQDDVIVVHGSSDKVEDVLSKISIKYKMVQKDKFDDLKLDPKSVLVLNCDGKGHPAYNDSQLASIREFVEKGGYVFSSDWELEYTIEKAFPGSIAKAGLSSQKKDDEYKVDIKPTIEGGRHPYMRDVFPLTTWDASAMSWKMDGMSFLIKILSPDVETLIESNELKKRFPETPCVAVTFHWKGGKVVKPVRGPAVSDGKAGHTQSGGASNAGCVLHVLSHFKHQKDKDSGDKFALQQLILNFFLEKQAQNKLAK
jgi:hypothetical protein